MFGEIDSGQKMATKSVDGEDGFLKLLRSLTKEEILEVLSHGFCKSCEISLQDSVRRLQNKKSAELSKPKHNNESPKSYSPQHSGFELTLSDGLLDVVSCTTTTVGGLSEDEKERIRFSNVISKKNFVHNEKIDGKTTNVLQGLELHTRVFNVDEQKKIVESVYEMQLMGRKGMLRDRTYSEPRKWMRGKGRVTIQFGCCYNYAVDRSGNPPGILREEEVDPLPSIFKKMIKRLVRWRILPPACIPNSCIVNIYDEGDCIPPHIDHHDFLRPFCTVSFLTESNILFGSNLKIVNSGEFAGPVSIPLPLGSVFILNGNGANIAKHCVPSVPGKRISITFRKMDDKKLPYSYTPDPELLGLKPISNSTPTKSPASASQIHQRVTSVNSEKTENSFLSDKDEFPSLGSLNLKSQTKAGKNRLKP